MTAPTKTVRVTATIDVDGVRARLLDAIDPDRPGWQLASDALLAIDGLRQEAERLRRELKFAESAAWDGAR